MTKKVAVMLADGFEEGESLFVIDIFRRAGFKCDGITINEEVVRGAHDIRVFSDKHVDDVNVADYDMIVLPGGQPGSDHLRDDERVVRLVQDFAHDESKYVAAICAATQVLAKAGIAEGKKLTSYPLDKYRNLFTNANYIDDNTAMEELVVVDGHLITSRGPASTLSFVYKLVEILGGDAEKLKEMMQYNALKQSIRACQ
ncbi:MAG: DJ-1/PfpI family protein [Erysipelotrichaceae bacterium]|nr:DJ-1/PfpI family protein [Erysipelotrichaceae bacterium]